MAARQVFPTRLASKSRVPGRHWQRPELNRNLTSSRYQSMETICKCNTMEIFLTGLLSPSLGSNDCLLAVSSAWGKAVACLVLPPSYLIHLSGLKWLLVFASSSRGNITAPPVPSLESSQDKAVVV